MSRKQQKPRRIAVAIRQALASGRAIATGVIRQAKRRGWKLQLVEIAEGNYAETMSDLVRKEYDGVIVSELTDAVAQALASAPFATVVIGRPDERLSARNKKTRYVYNDDHGIGAAGAQFLSGLGAFSSYAFVDADHPKSYCAAAREEGFVHALASARHDSTVLSIDAADDEKTACGKLTRALGHLPKPAAVMVATDKLALNVLEAAHQAGIDIPRQLAVIGVDNDELLCELAEPTLTSIEPDHVAEGELAARVLDALMRGRVPAADKNLVNRGYRTVERESARPISPATHLVHAAQDYIAANYMRNIGVADIVRHLNVSRRLADLRYRELTGKSLYQSITETRLETARELLSTTSLTTVKIISRCGFSDINSAAKLFKRRFGVTMGDYRKQHAESH